jgi:hypothetical protein
MSTEQKHHILIYSGGCAISALGPHTVSTVGFHIYLAPLACRKVEPVKIVSVMTIISSKYVHAIFIYDSRMRMTGCRCPSTQLHLLNHLLPCVIVDWVFVEIIHSVESVISSKDVNRSIMDNYTNGELSIKDKYLQRVCHVGTEYLWVVRKNFKWMNLLFNLLQGFNSK